MSSRQWVRVTRYYLAILAILVLLAAGKIGYELGYREGYYGAMEDEIGEPMERVPYHNSSWEELDAGQAGGSAGALRPTVCVRADHRLL